MFHYVAIENFSVMGQLVNNYIYCCILMSCSMEYIKAVLLFSSSVQHLT